MTSPIQTFRKDPDANVDFSLDWTLWLDGDTIVASNWSVDPGLTVGVSSFIATHTTIWLSGGTVGEDYEARNRITTSGGRTEDRTICILVGQR